VPDDRALGVVAAHALGFSRVAQVPGERLVVRGDRGDRGADPHGHGLTGAFGRVAGDADAPAQTECLGELVGKQ
jgi:hypothetical protein